MTAGNDLTARILIELSRIPHSLWWRQNAGLFRTVDGRRIVRASVDGVADILGCYRGAFYAIEVKAGGDRQRDTQRRFQAAVERAGGIYVIARSVEEAIAGVRG